MFDSGAKTSFISKAALKRTKHLPINTNPQRYLMADGCTSFKAIGFVKIIIEFGGIKTNILVGVVSSLCTDCILGMDYINKYKVNLNSKDQQIQIHTLKNMVTIPMENQIDNVKVLCRLISSTCIYPYQEKKIQIGTQVSSGQLLFFPAYHLTHYKNLISPHAFISIINHSAWISVYNPAASTCYLKSNIIIGTAAPSSTVAYISTILDTKAKDTTYEVNTTPLTSTSEQNIANSLMHLQDQQEFLRTQQILTRHHQLFHTTTTTIAETTKAHVICTRDAPPTTSRPYPQTNEKQNAMFNILQQMLKNKQIRPPHSQYSAPVLLVKKRDGSYRFIIDYRKLNDITIPDNYPLPNREHALEQVGGQRFYTKLDLRSGYFQIPIRHTICSAGTKPLQDRIEKILSIPQPTSLKQANAFIGTIGWYRKYIQDYAKIAAPILAVTNLITKNKYKFKWDTPQREAFNQLKNILINEPLFLNYPDPDATLILSTDASDYSIGGVLYQEINGERKNIYFHSQMLPKLQRKWPTIEKEALAIYYSVTRMKLYLLGREFIVQIDHCPLCDMHKKPSNNRRVDRISLILQQYNIKEIRHVHGKCNGMADYLSRFPRQLEDDDEFIEHDFGDIPAVQYPTTKSTSTNYQQIKTHMLGAVVTRAQAKANVNLNSPTIPDSTIEEASCLNDQPLQGEGHEFDVSTIAKAQKEDKLYQTKILALQENPNKCTYILENEILYKLSKTGIFTQKLLYVPPTMIQ
ncbi:unnamed protein product [Rotaria sp. Silwood2]|nr:unnamed protein product [Rotaria sp. Silwood2]